MESPPVLRPPESARLPVNGAELEQIDARLKAIEVHYLKQAKALREKTLLFHKVSVGSAAPRFLWDVSESDVDAGRKRKSLGKVLQIAIRSHIREIDSLEAQRNELLNEREWVRIQLSESIAVLKAREAKGAAADFLRCGAFPVEGLAGQPLKLLQDYGKIHDKETGLEWQSLGWWLGGVGSEARACATGTVVFTGKVPGRGRVVMLDHGFGRMTVYGNLNEDPKLPLNKGTVLQSGAPLGAPQGRLYFEVRQDGHAISPRDVVPAESLARYGF